MKIQVTKLDIERGIQRDHRRCAVTRAVRRASGYQKVVSSGLGWITIGQSAYATPSDAHRFIDAYDDGEPVEPFEFDLDNRVDG